MLPEQAVFGNHRLNVKFSAVKVFKQSNKALSGSADILEAHFPKVKPVHVIVEYGKPIDPKSLDKDTRKKIGSHCQGVIAEMLEKNNPQI